MRDRGRIASVPLAKRVEHGLEKALPGVYLSRYELVSFTTTPYAEVRRRVRLQHGAGWYCRCRCRCRRKRRCGDERSRDRARAAEPRGRYPHVKLAGGLAFVSGTSSRQPDDTIAGAEVGSDGEVHLDVAVQTTAVIENIGRILESVGASLEDLVTVTTYLVDMADFAGYNEVYGQFFDERPARQRRSLCASCPIRTC